MRAITLRQPWASLIGRGKSNETRSWRTSHRGPLAIHAAKTFPIEAMRFCLNPRVAETLAPLRMGDIPLEKCLPRGAVVAVAELVDCFQIPSLVPHGLRLSDNERVFGAYAPGRWVWVLENVRFVDPPIPARGRQGLWEWTPPEGWEDRMQMRSEP